MTRTYRQLTSLIVSLMALGVIAGAVAWACSPDADIGIDAFVVEPGDPVTVTGTAFTATVGGSTVPANVELRWDSAGGPVLAHAVGPSFAQAVRIPAAGPAEHAIFAIGRHPQTDAFQGSARATLRVGAAPNPAPAGGSTSAQTSGAERATVKSSAQAEPAGRPQGQTSATASGRESARARQSGQAAAVEVALPSSADRRVAGGDRSRAAAGAPAGRAATSSERSAFADAWSGFTGPSARSLIGRYSEAVVPGGGGDQGTGIVLFGLGILTLLAAGFLAKTRGRPVLSDDQRPPTD